MVFYTLIRSWTCFLAPRSLPISQRIKSKTPGVIVYAYKPNTLEAEAGGLPVGDKSEIHNMILSQK